MALEFVEGKKVFLISFDLQNVATEIEQDQVRETGHMRKGYALVDIYIESIYSSLSLI
jgi:citrate synthase